MSKMSRSLVYLLLVGTLVSPHRLLATPREPLERTTEIPVVTAVEKIRLDQHGNLRGAVVDEAGRPVGQSLVVIGQAGRPLGEQRTDAQGQFCFAGIRPGVYQVASLARVQNYHCIASDQASDAMSRGIIHRMPQEVVRGQCDNCEETSVRSRLYECLTNPALLVITVIVGGVIAVALNDDDAS